MKIRFPYPIQLVLANCNKEPVYDIGVGIAFWANGLWPENWISSEKVSNDRRFISPQSGPPLYQGRRDSLAKVQPSPKPASKDSRAAKSARAAEKKGGKTDCDGDRHATDVF